MLKLFVLLVGGALGTITRYSISLGAIRYLGSILPFGTLIVNLLGCFLVGLFFSIIRIDSYLWLLFVVGFCGAFTTFSALILDSYSLIYAGNIISALINILSSIIFGFILFILGSSIGQLFK